jgi:UDP-glucose 4-epimerase
MEKVNFIKGDTRDRTLMSGLISRFPVIFDCAGQVSHTRSLHNPWLDLEINLLGPLTILEAAKQSGHRPVVVFTSTRGVIGAGGAPAVGEQHPTDPRDPNGINKLAAEKYLLLYQRIYGIPVVILRLTNTFGPRAQVKTDEYGVINWFIRRALLGESIVLHGPAGQKRNYNYVEDVVDALIAAGLNSKAHGQVFHLGSNETLSLREMVEAIVALTGWRGKILYRQRPADRQAIEVGDYVANYDKIQQVIGWKPKFSITEGLRRTVEFYRKNLPEYLSSAESDLL